jgi:hypothetical protein
MATQTRSRSTTTERLYTRDEVLAMLAELSQVAPKPRAKAKPKAAPKPRPKAAHKDGVSKADVDAYRDLWKKRVALRKELGLSGGFAGDQASTHKGMKALCAKMEALTTKGVNSYLVKW